MSAALTLSFFACNSAPAPTPLPAPAAAPVQTNEAPTPTMVQAIYYTPGSAWVPDKPPTEQPLGPHMKFVTAQASAGNLVGNGLMTTAPRGLYLLRGDADAAARFVGADPGVAGAVLAHDATEPWAVMMSQLDRTKAGETLFVARYKPGTAWRSDVGLGEQSGMADHMNYVKGLFASGELLAGGPIGDGSSGGMYVLSATDAEAARALIDKDPAVVGAVFAPEIHGWQPMQIQALAK